MSGNKSTENPRFSTGADCVSGSRADKGASFDFQNLGNLLELLKGEVDSLIDRIDVDLAPFGFESRVGPEWAAVAESKPNSVESDPPKSLLSVLKP